VETLESMIRQELIREVEDLNERLAKLRERYSEVTRDIKYSGKAVIIATIVDRLTQKGYECIMRN
jgi:archaellum component FlaC